MHIRLFYGLFGDNKYPGGPGFNYASVSYSVVLGYLIKCRSAESL